MLCWAVYALACGPAYAQTLVEDFATDPQAKPPSLVQAQAMPPSLSVRPSSPIPTTAPARGDHYLEVAINNTSTQRIARFFVTERMIYTTPGELHELGIRIDDLHADADGRIALGLVSGLRYTFRPEHQRLDLQVADARRIPATLQNTPPRPPISASATGLVVNYEASIQTASPTQYGIYSEQRLFYPGGIVDNTGTAYWYANQHRYIRLDTSWSHSDPDSLVTTRIGDTISSSLTWTRPVRLAGAQRSRDFRLRPDLITYPVPTLAGSAAVPSAVDLYVNNVRQFSGEAPLGPFVINAVPAISGAGEAVIVTRDVLGRSVMTTVPLYIDSRLLARGLTDFSFEAGFVRRSYALRSFAYASDPSISASLRHGLSDRLTLEAHGEATRGVYNGGIGVLVEAAHAGVFNLSLAGSAGNGGRNALFGDIDGNGLFGNRAPPIDMGSTDTANASAVTRYVATPGGNGLQVAAGWQWRTPTLSADLQVKKATPHYSDLASAEGTPVPQFTYRATLAAPFRTFGTSSTASASFVGLKDPFYGDSKIGSLSYTVTLPRNTSLSASVYHDFGDTKNTGLFVAVSFPLGGALNASVNVGSDQGKPLFGAALTKTADYGGGFGWQVQSAWQSDVRQSLAQGSYRGRYGDLLATVVNAQSRTYGELDAAGSFVVMAGDVLAGRRIDDAFALVSTDGVPNVPVLHENRVIGKTNGTGHLLVPDLIAYEPNHLAIDPLGLPADTSVETTQLNLAPRSRGGVLARFPLRSFAGAQLFLVGAAGDPLPPGTLVTHRETGKRFVVGYDGLAFIDDLLDTNTLDASLAGKPCEIIVPFRQQHNTLPTLGPFICNEGRP